MNTKNQIQSRSDTSTSLDKKHARHKKWRIKNRERELIRLRKWYAEHKKEVLEYNRRYRANNKEKTSQWHNNWLQRNRVRMKEYWAKYHKTDAAKQTAKNYRSKTKKRASKYNLIYRLTHDLRAKNKAWRILNVEKVRHAKHARRAREKIC